MLIVVRHVPHCPSSLLFFCSEKEAMDFVDPDGGHIEIVTVEGKTRPIGTWVDVDPLSIERLDPSVHS